MDPASALTTSDQLRLTAGPGHSYPVSPNEVLPGQSNPVHCSGCGRGGSPSQPKIQHNKLGTHFPSPSSNQQNISINHHLFLSPYPSPPPFPTLLLQLKPVPGLVRSILEFLASSSPVLLWALPVSNKFQSVNSPLTLIHLPCGYLYGVTPLAPVLPSQSLLLLLLLLLLHRITYASIRAKVENNQLSRTGVYFPSPQRQSPPCLRVSQPVVLFVFY